MQRKKKTHREHPLLFGGQNTCKIWPLWVDKKSPQWYEVTVLVQGTAGTTKTKQISTPPGASQAPQLWGVSLQPLCPWDLCLSLCLRLASESPPLPLRLPLSLPQTTDQVETTGLLSEEEEEKKDLNTGIAINARTKGSNLVMANSILGQRQFIIKARFWFCWNFYKCTTIW